MPPHTYASHIFKRAGCAKISKTLMSVVSERGGLGLSYCSVGERKVKEEGGRSVYLIIVGRRFNLFKILIEIHLVTVL